MCSMAAPDRIWAEAYKGGGGFWACDAASYEQGDSTSYTRTDIYDAVVKENEMLRGALRRISEYYPKSSYDCDDEAYTLKSIASSALK